MSPKSLFFWLTGKFTQVTVFTAWGDFSCVQKQDPLRKMRQDNAVKLLVEEWTRKREDEYWKKTVPFKELTLILGQTTGRWRELTNLSASDITSPHMSPAFFAYWSCSHSFLCLCGTWCVEPLTLISWYWQMYIKEITQWPDNCQVKSRKLMTDHSYLLWRTDLAWNIFYFIFSLSLHYKADILSKKRCDYHHHQQQHTPSLY